MFNLIKMSFLLFVSAFCLACPTQAVVQGTVTTTAASEDGGAAIEGAQLDLDCPDKRLLFIGITNRAGQFHYNPDEPISTECAIQVSQSGYGTERYPVCDICATDVCGLAAAQGSEETPTCPEIDFTAQLEAE